jgi:hypothetical protein
MVDGLWLMVNGYWLVVDGLGFGVLLMMPLGCSDSYGGGSKLIKVPGNTKYPGIKRYRGYHAPTGSKELPGLCTMCSNRYG